MKTLIAGIGNIFMGDDAFGVEVVKRMMKRSLPNGVTVRDYGIRSYDLAYALMDSWDLVILVDALPGNGKPGTLYVMEPELLEDGASPPSLDAHIMNPESVLRLVAALGGRAGRILIVGCEPQTVEPDQYGNIELSAPVSGAIDEAIEILEALISRATSDTIAA
jgi:hydrogenase maturation protease